MTKEANSQVTMPNDTSRLVKLALLTGIIQPFKLRHCMQSGMAHPRTDYIFPVC